MPAAPSTYAVAGDAPFQCFREPTGDLWVAPGRLVNYGSSSTDTFTTAGAHIGGVGGANGNQHFVGGSGRNLLVSGGPADDDFPTGYFRPSEPDLWESPAYPDASISRDPGSGDLTLNDGTDDVATGPGTSAYVGTPSAGTFPITQWVLTVDTPTYTTWEGLEDPVAALYLEKSTGSAEITYGGSVVVATRSSGPGDDPSGIYAATPDGETDYNGGGAWDYTVSGGGGSATLTASAYGEATYNGSSPFTFDVTPEGDPIGQPASICADTGSAQAGIFAWSAWQQWTSEDDGDWTITIDGSGEASLSDGTDVVAVREADSSKLYDASGPYASTAYGDASYGGTDSETEGVSSAGTFGDQSLALAFTVGDIDTWNGVTDSSQYVELNTITGDAILYDGNGEIAERLGGSTTDIDGTYTATSLGEELYNSSTTWDFTVSTSSIDTGFSVSANTLPKRSLEGVVFCVVARDSGSGEATGISGPFYAAAMDTNTSTARSVPIATIAADGAFEQIQFGPINWIIA